MRVWIDGDGSIQIGTTGYLLETVVAGRSAWTFHDRPVKGGRVGRVVALGKGHRSNRVQIRELQGICDIGDRIVSVDGRPTNTVAELQDAVDALHPFTQVIVRVQLRTWPYNIVPRTFTVPAPR